MPTVPVPFSSPTITLPDTASSRAFGNSPHNDVIPKTNNINQTKSHQTTPNHTNQTKLNNQPVPNLLYYYPLHCHATDVLARPALPSPSPPFSTHFSLIITVRGPHKPHPAPPKRPKKPKKKHHTPPKPLTNTPSTPISRHRLPLPAPPALTLLFFSCGGHVPA